MKDEMKKELSKVGYYTKTTIPALTKRHYSSDREACPLAGAEKKVISMSSVNHGEDF
jgi:hypothetical protein